MPVLMKADVEKYFQKYPNRTEFVIPMGITRIGMNAFKDCKKLRKIDIPDSIGLTEISQNAFENCSELCSVRLPITLEAIGENAFKDCVKLKKIKLPDKIKKIDDMTLASRENMYTRLKEENCSDQLLPRTLLKKQRNRQVW